MPILTIKPAPIGRMLIGVLIMMPGLLGGAVHAQSLPRWEVGIGVSVLSLPYYRGAASGRSYVLPFPYVKYRGEHLRVDEEGIRSYLFRSDRVKLNFSLAGGVPVPSDGNSIRHDMPRLDPTVEIGPSLEILLSKPAESNRSLWLKIPVRAALSVGWGNIDHQGWVLAPYIEYVVRQGNPSAPWIIDLSAGPQFADRAYHDYFYEVPTAYATASRPEYHPDAGYSGSRMTLSLQKRWGDYWLGAFIRYDTLQGAVFSDSPLVEQRHYLALGAAVIKLLAVSKKLEERP